MSGILDMYLVQKPNSDISIWDTLKLLTFKDISRAKEFNQDIGNWDVSKVRF